MRVRARVHARRRTRLALAVGVGALATLALACTALAATITKYKQTQVVEPFTKTQLSGGQFAAMSADGSTLVVGAPGANDSRGLVVFYTRENGKWVERQTIQDPYGTPDNEFGGQAALSADGNVAELPILNVTAGRTNDILMYVRSGSTWQLADTISAPTGVNGSDFLAGPISPDGNTVTAATQYSLTSAGDNTYVFTRSGATWSLHQTIPAPLANGFQFAPTAFSGNGQTMVLSGQTGSPWQGAIVFYTDTGGIWTQQGPAITDPLWSATTTPKDFFGDDVALSTNGDIAFVGAWGTNDFQGAFYIYTRSGGTWKRTQSVINTAPNPAPDPDQDAGEGLGYSVSVSGDGNTALIGYGGITPSQSATWVYARTGAIWTRVQSIAETGRATLSTNAATAIGVGTRTSLLSTVSFARTAAVVPNLRVLWTVERDWVQAQITPVAGASHYALFATSATAPGRTGVCKVVNTGIGRRVRCTVTLTRGTWTLVAHAESASGIIAQSSHRAAVN